MSEILQLNYYYGIEAEQFSFYRVPRLLIKDERFKKLSSDAKLLYGLMLDRMSLSIKNKETVYSLLVHYEFYFIRLKINKTVSINVIIDIILVMKSLKCD